MIIVDASISLKWIIPESDSDKARALRSEPLGAPVIWTAEVGNALWRLVRVGQLTDVQARLSLQELRTNVSVSDSDDVDRALDLAIAIDHPIYDCLYLALAIRENTHVVTADTRFSSAVRKHKRWSANIKLLSEL